VASAIRNLSASFRNSRRHYVCDALEILQNDEMMILQDEDYCIALKVVGYEGKAKILVLIKIVTGLSNSDNLRIGWAIVSSIT
jgi:hypothetical protein